MSKLDKYESLDHHEYMRWRVRVDAGLKARGHEPLADVAMYALFQEGYPVSRAIDEVVSMERDNGTT